MAGGPEGHFTDSLEVDGLVEGDEWAHVDALDPDAGYWARRFAQLVNWRARGEKAVIEPSSPAMDEIHEPRTRHRSAPSCLAGRASRGCRRHSRLARNADVAAPATAGRV